MQKKYNIIRMYSYLLSNLLIKTILFMILYMIISKKFAAVNSKTTNVTILKGFIRSQIFLSTSGVLCLVYSNHLLYSWFSMWWFHKIPQTKTVLPQIVQSIMSIPCVFMCIHVILLSTSPIFPPTTNLTIYQLQNPVFYFIMPLKLSDIDA